MPMSIDSFSFDLFGITRRKASTDGDATVSRKPPVENQDARPDTRGERARDQEGFFWCMFPVLW